MAQETMLVQDSPPATRNIIGKNQIDEAPPAVQILWKLATSLFTPPEHFRLRAPTVEKSWGLFGPRAVKKTSFAIERNFTSRLPPPRPGHIRIFTPIEGEVIIVEHNTKTNKFMVTTRTDNIDGDAGFEHNHVEDLPLTSATRHLERFKTTFVPTP